VSGIVFDAGGLIAIEREDRFVHIMIDEAMRQNDPLFLPATVLAQVMRKPAVQVRLQKVLQYEHTHVLRLDHADAIEVGMLLASSKTRDIVDAHVIVCAKRLAVAVLTSDPKDLRMLGPGVSLISV
jgi:hypothetical protein